MDFDEMNPEHVIGRGCALKNLAMYPGWQHVLDMMEDLCRKAENELVQSTSLDPQALFGMQKRACGMRELVEQIQAKVAFYVQESKSLVEGQDE